MYYLFKVIHIERIHLGGIPEFFLFLFLFMSDLFGILLNIIVL